MGYGDSNSKTRQNRTNPFTNEFQFTKLKYGNDD